MRSKILLHISFVGTAYCGWQKQKNKVTVQEKLTEAAEALFGYPCDITGCSRTDSGVHANMFCATVTKKKESTLDTTVPLEKIPRALNNFLPNDISVISASCVEESFHPRYDVAFKEYVYLIFDRPERDPFSASRVWHLPRGFTPEAIENMDRAAKAFVGKYDFSAFMAQGSKIEDATRTVMYAGCEKHGNTVVFRIAADGFLYNMVRIMAGTLVDVGEGRTSPDDIKKIIEGKDRKQAGRTAPADGLYLNKVSYDLSK